MKSSPHIGIGTQLGTPLNVLRGAGCGATRAFVAVIAALCRDFEVILLKSAFAERSYPVAARRSWKIRRSILKAMLARPIFASPRAMPMVRTKSPI